MNSSNEFSVNIVLQDDGPTTNGQIAASDNNANLSNTTQNKGAIPKSKTAKLSSIPKKPTKLNNNVDEELLTKSSNNVPDGVLQMHSDLLRLNGYSDQISRISTNYLDDYKVSLYQNGSDNNCENRYAKNQCSSINENNRDIYNTSSGDGSTSEASCRVSSYQPTTSSSREFDREKLQLKIDNESSSSDDNELLSMSDDGCIYTYKGDHVADLPSSFFSLDIPLPRSPEVIAQNRQGNASPEMDFLEMDFDPGPSGDADSDSECNAELENADNLPQDPTYRTVVNSEHTYSDNKLQNVDPAGVYYEMGSIGAARCHDLTNQTNPLNIPQASTSSLNLPSPSTSVKQDSPTSTITERLRKMRMPWSCSLAQRTSSRSSNRFVRRHHNANGELISPTERVSSPVNDINVLHCYMENSKSYVIENLVVDKAMIWTEEEAARKQVTQIGPSACGATAVINVLNALRFPLPSLDTIREAVTTRTRANSSPLTEYLLSRSIAGSTHHDLINGLETLTEGQLYARFFHMFPERVVNLSAWLQFWIKHGAVPIATLNLQKCLATTISDAWHHQMIFGVSSRGIYLANPLECVEPYQLWPQLSSESILLIKNEDVMSRWNVNTDLDELIKINDSRWSRINIVGQVANMVRESNKEKRHGISTMPYIKIPAAYSSGITLVMRLDAPLCPLLMHCPELPLLPPAYDEASGYSDLLY